MNVKGKHDAENGERDAVERLPQERTRPDEDRELLRASVGVDALDERPQTKTLAAGEHDRPEAFRRDAQRHRTQEHHPKDMRTATRKSPFKRNRRARSKCPEGDPPRRGRRSGVVRSRDK